MPKWLDRAKETYSFHRRNLLLDSNWNLTKTATALKRSLGSVGEDLMIAHYYKDYQEQLERCEFARDALAFIRKKKKEMNWDEIV